MSRLPPGPRLSAVQRVRYLKNPYRFFRGCRARYGDVFTVTTTAKAAVTSRPDGVRAIFTAPPDQFLVKLPAAQQTILGSASLTNFSGEPHRRERRLLAPPLQGNRMRALGPLMRAAADRAIDGWTPGKTLIAHEAAMGIALDVILRALFGAEDAAERERLAAAVRGFVHGFSHPLWLMTALFRLPAPPVGPWARFRKAKADLDALVFGLIDARRADPAGRTDVLTAFATATYPDGSVMTRDALRDNLVTYLLAGHETSAMSLTWALYWLGRHPDVRDKLLAELDPLGDTPDPDAVARLPYLGAVLNETFRLFPAVPEVIRMIARPMDLDGFTIPVGVNVVACTALVHSREDLYPDPDEFRPGRFLERSFGPFEFFPFGGGDRKCPGASFAEYETKVALATVLRRCRYRLASDAPPRLGRRGFLMGPADGVPIVYEGPR